MLKVTILDGLSGLAALTPRPIDVCECLVSSFGFFWTGGDAPSTSGVLLSGRGRFGALAVPGVRAMLGFLSGGRAATATAAMAGDAATIESPAGCSGTATAMDGL